MPKWPGSGPPEQIPSIPELSLTYDKIADGEPIGHGGNADVTLVVVIRGSREISVAVKQPRLQGTLHADTVDRFVEEAEVWDKLDDHNHIVGLYDWGTEPLPWLAMEYMDGGTLEDRLVDVRPPVDQAAWIGLCVCRAVRHAHRHGIAHHDIKPANVLFQQVDEGWDLPKVSDWGLARLLLEETGSIEGLSPHYAAPEQFDPESYGSPDDRTDIYQIGALLYALFTGGPPFDGPAAAVMNRVLNKEPTPPSQIADVPDRVDEIVMPALAKQKEDRYDSVVYLRDSLDELYAALETNPADEASTNNTAESVDTEQDDTKTTQADTQTEQTIKRSESTEVDHSELTQKKSSDESSVSTRRVILGVVGAGVIGTGAWQVLTADNEITSRESGDNSDQVHNDDPDQDSESTAAVSGADPLGQPVTSAGISWDDLGDLEGELTIYSGRTRNQIDPVFEQLEQRYEGLTIDRNYGDNDTQINQLIQEGDATPADIFYSQDPGALGAVTNEGLTQALPTDIVDTVPASYRHPDGLWSGISGRVRSIQYNSARLEETPFDSWEELSTSIYDYAEDDRFEGIISARPNSGTFRAFIQAFVELEGEEATRQWVRDFMDQDPQLFTSGSNQAKAINRGGDDDPIVGLGNSYYSARILTENPDTPLRVTFTNGDPGALFNVAGIAATNGVDDPELVAEFIRHLVAIEGQESMMEANGEFPVINGVEYVDPLPGPDELNPPTFDLTSFDTELPQARNLLEDEGMLPR